MFIDTNYFDYLLFFANHIALFLNCRCLAKYGLGQAAEDSSVKILEEEYSKGQKVNLDDCFGLHTKEEEVNKRTLYCCMMFRSC